LNGGQSVGVNIFLKFNLIRQFVYKDCGQTAFLTALKILEGNSSIPYLREFCNTNLILDHIKPQTKFGFKGIGVTNKCEKLIKEVQRGNG